MLIRGKTGKDSSYNTNQKIIQKIYNFAFKFEGYYIACIQAPLNQCWFCQIITPILTSRKNVTHNKERKDKEISFVNLVHTVHTLTKETKCLSV